MRRKILYPLIGFIILLIAVAIWLIPQWQVNAYRSRFDNTTLAALEPKDRVAFETNLITVENNARSTLAQSIGGLLLIFSLGATWYNIKATQKNSQETIRVAEEGKITERFSKAIELLGNSQVEVRLGGIYALERIAKDSQKDHWTIIEVLTSFVREKAKIGTEAATTSTDIQAILNVINGRKWIETEGAQKINLAKTDLIRADFSGAPLSGADLSMAELTRIDLSEANLSEANLSEANLTGANLHNVDLSRANLSGASLRANFFGANLSGANLSGANLSGAYLANANLSEAYLTAANLIAANLTGTNLRKADLRQADLRQADLRGADLTDADFTGANLTDANLTNTKGLPLAMPDLASSKIETEHYET